MSEVISLTITDQFERHIFKLANKNQWRFSKALEIVLRDNSPLDPVVDRSEPRSISVRISRDLYKELTSDTKLSVSMAIHKRLNYVILHGRKTREYNNVQIPQYEYTLLKSLGDGDVVVGLKLVLNTI